MESDGGERDDTKRVAHGRPMANEGVASFGGIHMNAGPFGSGSDKQQDETLLGKWAHKERTLNGTVSFKAHQEDEPSVFTSRANLLDIDVQIMSSQIHDGGVSHAMPSGIQQEKSVAAVSGRSGLTDVAKMNANIDQGPHKIAET